MSILLGETLTAPIPGKDIATQPTGDNSKLVLAICVTWALMGLVALWRLGAFRRRSIVGPPRLDVADSAWDLTSVLLIGFAGGIAVARLLHPTPGQSQLMDLAISAALDLATTVIIFVLLRFIRPGMIQRLGLRVRQLPLGLVGGAFALFILYPLIQLTGVAVQTVFDRFHLNQAKPHEVLRFLNQSPSPGLTVFAISLAVVIAPLSEELMYRGLLQTILARAFSALRRGDYPATAEVGGFARWSAVVVTSIIFAASHNELEFLAPLFLLALGLGYVYERTGNLWITITCHALFNCAQIVLSQAASR